MWKINWGSFSCTRLPMMALQHMGEDSEQPMQLSINMVCVEHWTTFVWLEISHCNDNKNAKNCFSKYTLLPLYQKKKKYTLLHFFLALVYLPAAFLVWLLRRVYSPSQKLWAAAKPLLFTGVRWGNKARIVFPYLTKKEVQNCLPVSIILCIFSISLR